MIQPLRAISPTAALLGSHATALRREAFAADFNLIHVIPAHSPDLAAVLR
jgi:hypothetical protein